MLLIEDAKQFELSILIEFELFRLVILVSLFMSPKTNQYFTCILSSTNISFKYPQKFVLLDNANEITRLIIGGF